jgi:hypothetical protein
MEQYYVYIIDSSYIRQDDPDSKFKDLTKPLSCWYKSTELGKFFFKEANPSPILPYYTPPADWSEKAACEIAKLLNLPVARYELATLIIDGTNEKIDGVISVNCFPAESKIAFSNTGEELLIMASQFDKSSSNAHTIENNLIALDLADVKPPSNWEAKIIGINTGAEVFVGYILLDALINNIDRHSSNWGVIGVKEGTGIKLELMPSFDHALSLGSNDNNEFNLSPSAYVNEYSLSAFREENYNLSTLEVFNRAAELYPEAAAIWKEKLAAITSSQIEEIFDRIPEGRITPTAATFAKALLEYNRSQILNLDLESIQPQLDEQAILTAIETLKQEVIEACKLPTLDFDEDTLSYMRDFVIHRSTKNSNASQSTVGYEDELNRRLFEAIENDLSIFDKGDVLNLKYLIQEEMENEGLINSYCLDDSSGSDMYKSNPIAKLENTNPPKQSQSDDLGESI